MIDFLAVLKEKGLKNTAARRAIFDTLKAANQPLSPTEITRQLPRVDRVSVYRTLETFLRHTIIIPVPHGWKQRYELAEPFKPHHHHLTCTNCHRVALISDPALEDLMSKIASKDGFYMTSHLLEISGLCATCHATDRAHAPAQAARREAP